MGRNRPDRLDRLIDEVARGQRRLESISDAQLRERVRLALRIHASTRARPDPYQRMRMRARVLAGIERRPRGLRDTAWTALDIAWTALEHLARPAPYLVRGLALAAILFAAGAGMTLASADTLPDDALYPVKLASEQMRLALAVAPDDRAMVSLSIAEHRLSEAERLARQGRTAEALMASAAYSQQIAAAAADLAPTATAALADRFERSFAAQRERARSLAVALSTDRSSARAATVLAIIAAPTTVPARDAVQRVVETTATVASELAAAAQRIQAPSPRPAAATSAPEAAEETAPPTAQATSRPTPPPGEADRARSATVSAAAAPSTDAVRGAPARPAAEPTRTRRPSATPTASASPTPDRHGAEAAERTKRVKEFVDKAAEKVREWVAQHGPRKGDHDEGGGADRGGGTTGGARRGGDD